MSAIGPGDFVECVDAMDCAHLMVGAIYVIARVWRDQPSWYDDGSLGDGYDLVAVPRDGGAYVYAAERFRPLDAQQTRISKGLLKPADAPADLQGVDA